MGNEIVEGSSVVVKITNRDAYAMGCAEVLDGACGVVTQTVRNGDWKVLVEFDEPLPNWWSNGSPVTAFWFEIDELQPVGIA